MDCWTVGLLLRRGGEKRGGQMDFHHGGGGGGPLRGCSLAASSAKPHARPILSDGEVAVCHRTYFVHTCTYSL